MTRDLISSQSSQCAVGLYNLNQKTQEVCWFFWVKICYAVQNLSKKTSVMGAWRVLWLKSQAKSKLSNNLLKIWGKFNFFAIWENKWLEIQQNNKVELFLDFKFGKNLFQDPFLTSWWGQGGQVGGQILMFTQSLSNSQRMNLFGSYLNIVSKIWKKFILRPFLTPPPPQGGGGGIVNWGSNTNFNSIFTKFTLNGPFWKLSTLSESNLEKIHSMTPFWPLKGIRGSSGGEILVFNQSSPNSHWTDRFGNYQHFLSQIWKNTF
jgi:hypothetical protein